MVFPFEYGIQGGVENEPAGAAATDLQRGAAVPSGKRAAGDGGRAAGAASQFYDGVHTGPSTALWQHTVRESAW